MFIIGKSEKWKLCVNPFWACEFFRQPDGGVNKTVKGCCFYRVTPIQYTPHPTY